MHDHPVRQIRKASGLTSEEFAKLVGLSLPLIKKIEGRKHSGSISLEHAQAIAEATGCSARCLTGDTSPIGFDGRPYTRNTFESWRLVQDNARNSLLSQRDTYSAAYLAGELITAIAGTYAKVEAIPAAYRFLARLSNFLSEEAGNLENADPESKSEMNRILSKTGTIGPVSFTSRGVEMARRPSRGYPKENRGVTEILKNPELVQQLALEGNLERVIRAGDNGELFCIHCWEVRDQWFSLLRQDPDNGVAVGPEPKINTRVWQVVPMSQVTKEKLIYGEEDEEF